MHNMPKLDDPLHDAEIGSRDSTIDTTRIDDVRIGAVRPLMTPALLQERVPVLDNTLALVEQSHIEYLQRGREGEESMWRIRGKRSPREKI